MKTHFIVSYDPITFNGQTVAPCGAIIRNPELVHMQETEARGFPEFSSLRDCSKCFRRAEMEAEFRGGKTYVYGIVEAQEAKNAQAESAA